MPSIRTQILESEILVFATPTWLGRPSIGFTIPGQAWTYWNRGPGPGDDYLESEAGKDWSHSTGKAAAANLLAAARALEANPIPAPPS